MAAPRTSLRDCSAAVLVAWDTNRDTLAGAVKALRAALAKPIPAVRPTGAPCQPRTGTMQEAVLAMVRRTEGATLAEICATTGWQRHTARAFLSVVTKRLGLALTA